MDNGSIPGARVPKAKATVRGSATSGPHGKGGGGPVENGLRLPKPGNNVKGSKC